MKLKKIDISITVTAFYMKIAGFWLANNRVEERWRIFAMSYTVFVLLFAIWVESRDFYHNWGDFSETIYITSNLLNLYMVLSKIIASFLQKKELLALLEYTNTNFWQSTYNPHEQTIMDICKRGCTFFVCTFAFFSEGTIASYVVRPIVDNMGKNKSDRMLPFNMWLNLPLSISPWFEMAFVMQALFVFHIGACYLSLDNCLCVINLHTACQFRILQHRFSNLCGTVESTDSSYEVPEKLCNTTKTYAFFRKYVQQHQALITYCNKLQNVFSVIVLGQVLLLSVLICLDGYLIVIDSGPVSRRCIFVFHLTGCMCQLLSFTYSCDCLIRESMNVANAVYSCQWAIMPLDKGGKMIRKDLQLVIVRSSIPCCLTASGFFVVSLETYIKLTLKYRVNISNMEHLILKACPKLIYLSFLTLRQPTFLAIFSIFIIWIYSSYIIFLVTQINAVFESNKKIQKKYEQHIKENI